MLYTQIPKNAFETIQLNAGILLTAFNPATGEYDEDTIIGATSGGNEFTSSPSYTDFGEDIDNCPKNMMELKKLDSYDVQMTGSFVTVDATLGKMLVGAADIDAQDDTHIIPRKDLKISDFHDLWWVGDYSDVNNGDNAGFIAIHMMNVLNAGGFSLKTTDKQKGTFDFTFVAHVSMAAQNVVPFEIYIRKGEAAETPSIYLNKHLIDLVSGDTELLVATVVPADATITWSS